MSLIGLLAWAWGAGFCVVLGDELLAVLGEEQALIIQLRATPVRTQPTN